MSEAQPFAVQSAAAAPSPVRAAIARAAQATGMDFDYLLAQAKLESALDPSARARTSSAAGLYQFTRGTWLETLDRHGERHGLGWAGEAISGKRVNDPAMAAQILALRNDPEASALMAAELARDNRAGLATVLGRDPDASELYLGHFLGLGGASRFLTELARDPGQSAAALMPRAAQANRAIFYEKTGAARSVSEVMELVRGKVTGAMEGETEAPLHGAGSAWAELGTQFRATGPNRAASRQAAAYAPRGLPVPALPSAPARPSMADTLHSAFGASGADGAASAPASVRKAYASFARFGL